MSLSTLYQVDSFTTQPFAGNPAGVCVVDAPMPDARMRHIAAEMNCAETAFLWPEEGGMFRLRWFTPEVEIDLCGHATLASAHILFEQNMVPTGSVIQFITRSGILSATRKGSGIELDFPSRPPVAASGPPGLEEALGVQPVWIGRCGGDYLVEVTSPEVLRAATPNFAALRNVDARGVMITCLGDTTEFDFLSRFFAPIEGIDEDHVTGSAHCCFTPYWSAKLNKRSMTGYQASRRGGTVRVHLRGDRVLLHGNAVTTLRCEILV